MLDTKLIESTLALTGKIMADVMEWIPLTKRWDTSWDYGFSIEKFSYYLLSPEFIEKYLDIIDWEYNPDYYDDSYPFWVAYSDFWVAIWEYQLWNEQLLTNLLSKIW